MEAGLRHPRALGELTDGLVLHVCSASPFGLIPLSVSCFFPRLFLFVCVFLNDACFCFVCFQWWPLVQHGAQLQLQGRCHCFCREEWWVITWSANPCLKKGCQTLDRDPQNFCTLGKKQSRCEQAIWFVIHWNVSRGFFFSLSSLSLMFTLHNNSQQPQSPKRIGKINLGLCVYLSCLLFQVGVTISRKRGRPSQEWSHMGLTSPGTSGREGLPSKPTPTIWFPASLPQSHC